MNQSALYTLSYGMYLVSSMDETRPIGCVANSAMQITSEPKTIALSLNKLNYTHEVISKNLKFAISVVTEETDPQIIGTFGFNCSKDTNKFENVDYTMIDNMPVISQSCAYFICEVKSQLDCGTHTVFLAEIVNCDVNLKQSPMSYSYYHKVVKGKTAKNAPTYVEEKSDNYKCSICGYEYTDEKAFEELPDDFVCPICKQPKSVFKKN